jgi:tyrosinase
MAGRAVLAAVTVSLGLFSETNAWPFAKRQSLTTDDIQKQALENAYKVLDGTLDDGMTRKEGCTKETVGIRKE